MKEQDRLIYERVRCNTEETGVYEGDYRVFAVKGIQSFTVKFASTAGICRQLGLFAARIATCSVCLFLFAFLIVAAPAQSSAQVAIGVSVTFPPPALPVYVQPLCPGPGYIWIPGYWAWDPAIGYYWVPGTWVPAPYPGALWTPGYWGWSDGTYVWYDGYWGPVVGFYGGINYGFGYTGYGYHGGYWRHGAFYYNRAVNNVSVTNIRNVYNRTVINRVNVTRVSYNGGRGGVRLQPTAAQLAAAGQRHSPPTAEQRHQEQAARSYSRQRATVNRGRPAIAATPKPGEFTGRGLVGARRAGAPYKAPPPSHTAVPEAPHRAQHPAGFERGPAAGEPGHAVPSAVPRSERVRPAKPHPGMAPSHTAPGHVSPYSGEARPHMAPHAVPERPAVIHPPSPPHAAPERSFTAHPPGPPRAAPQRQGAPHPPQAGGGKHEGGREH